METLEQVLVSYGVNGCTLSEIPVDILEKARSSNIAEVNSIDDLAMLAQDYLRTDMPNYVDTNTADIGDLRRYVLRLKGPEWCRLVLNNKTKKGPHYYILTSLLITHPDGISNEDIARELNTNMKQSYSWLRILREEGLVMTKSVGDKKMYVYNFDMLGKCGDSSPSQSMDYTQTTAGKEDPIGDTQHACSGNTPARRQKMNGIKVGLDARNKAEEKASEVVGYDANEIARKLFKVMRGKKLDAIPIDDLPGYLAVSAEEMANIIEELRKRHFIRVVGDADGTRSVVPLSLADEDVARQLVDLGDARRIMCLSDIRPLVTKILPTAFDNGDGAILEIFESNGFNIVEIRSKYLPTEFVIMHPCIAETDDELLSMLRDAKENVSRQFRTKIWRVFFKNHAFAAADNGYYFALRHRVEAFYAFLIKEIEASDFKLVFDKNTLLRMGFATFAACVPLAQDDILSAIVFECAKMTDEKEFVAELERLADGEEERDSAAYALKLEKCRDFASRFTCGEILGLVSRDRALTTYLRSKMCVAEFGKILDAIVHYGLFRVADREDAHYFQMDEQANASVDSIYAEIDKDRKSADRGIVSIEDRRAFYDAVCESEQDMFYDRAREFLRTVGDPQARRYYSKKLQSFK